MISSPVIWSLLCFPGGRYWSPGGRPAGRHQSSPCHQRASFPDIYFSWQPNRPGHRAKFSMFSVVQSLQDHGVCPEIIPEIKGDISLAEVLYENGVQVNPGEELAPKQVRVPPTVSWNAKEGTYYTLMFIDPDAPSRTNPKKHCCKHWMVVNIPGKEVSRGVVDTEYVGCGPPEGSGLHRYIFLVYAQPGPLEKYKSNHKPISGYSIGGRIPFSAADFSRENGLGQPVAANFFQAQYDESVKEITKKMMKFPYVFGNVGNILSMKISDVFK